MEFELMMFGKFLSSFDDKRYILDDGINTLSCFYKDMKFSKTG